MGRAGRDCRQRHPDGVLSCATEHLSRHSLLPSWTPAKSLRKTISVACYFTGPISETVFLRRKVVNVPGAAGAATLDLNSASDVTYEWLDSSSLAHGALLLGGKYYLKRIPVKLLVELCGMSPGTLIEVQSGRSRPQRKKPAQHLKMWAKERTVLQKVNKIKNIPDQELRNLPPDVKEDLDTHFSGILSNHSDLRKSIEPFNRQDRRL